MVTAIALANDNELTSLAGRIVEEHRLCQAAMSGALSHALKAGDLLITAKALCEHGSWESWVQQHCSLSDRTARQYMQLADSREALEAKRHRGAVLTVKTARALIAKPRAFRQIETPQPLLIEKPSVTDAKQTASTVSAPATKRATFNRTNDNVDWAWWTWNPVTGCLHDCPYCYARDIANRFYPQKFTPTFHADRLSAPANTTLPRSDDERSRRVFTCSMADLFGKWVPQEWIEAVFAQVRDHQEWEFLFLTKFPQRLAELHWPDNAWVGTSVDRQYRVEIAERAFNGVQAGVKWLSCEPMLEPLRFTRLELFDLVVIGGASASSQTAEFWPPYDWIHELVVQARDAGCKVYLKANALSRDTPVPKELPRTHVKEHA